MATRLGEPEREAAVSSFDCTRRGTRVILSGWRELPRALLEQMGLKPDGSHLRFAEDFAQALALSEG
jgi:hypothetical protein